MRHAYRVSLVAEEVDILQARVQMAETVRFIPTGGKYIKRDLAADGIAKHVDEPHCRTGRTLYVKP